MSDINWLEQRRAPIERYDPSERTEFRRDRDRIFYSDAFRRLEDVTQVARVSHIGIHNRMTHSLRVEQLSQSIISRLTHDQLPKRSNSWADFAQTDDVNSVEAMVAAACLGHDIGHPPFGHTGEEALQEVVYCPKHRSTTYDEDHIIPEARLTDKKEVKQCEQCDLPDGFEGNAQTLRVLALTAIGSEFLPDAYGYSGLNLTRGTLRAVVKYPWLRGADLIKKKFDESYRGKSWSKWGAYDCDRGILNWVFADDDEPAFSAYGSLDTKEKRRCADSEAIKGKTEQDFIWHQTLLSSIMDRADEISYAVHDFEDFYRVGMIPILQIKTDLEQGGSPSLEYFLKYIEREGPLVAGNELHQFASIAPCLEKRRLQEYQTTLSKIERCLGHWPSKRFVGGAVDVARVSSGKTRAINDITDDLVIQDSGSGDPSAFKVALGENADFYVNILTQLLWYYVIDSESMTPIRQGQRKIIQTIYRVLLDEALEGWSVNECREVGKNSRRMPSQLIDLLRINSSQDPGFGSYGLQGRGEHQTIARSVVDYICTLTDGEAYLLYAKITGNPDFSKLVPMGG